MLAFGLVHLMTTITPVGFAKTCESLPGLLLTPNHARSAFPSSVCGLAEVRGVREVMPVFALGLVCIEVARTSPSSFAFTDVLRLRVP